MALVSSDQETMLATLQQKFNMYIENNWFVSIHINTPYMEMHQAFCPEIALANSSELNLTFGHFDLCLYFATITKFDIRLETEESFCIVVDDVEMYLDFLLE